MVIPFETRQYVFERVKMKVPNVITVTPNVLQPYRHYLHVLPPKTKVDFIWPVPDKSFQVRELFLIRISYQCLEHSRVLGAFEGHRSAEASRTVPSPSSPASTYASASPQLSNDIWFPMALMKLFYSWSPPRRGVNLFWYCGTDYSSSISLQYRAWSTVRFVYSWPKWEDIAVHLFTAVFKYQNPEHWREWFGNNKLLSALIYLMIMTDWKRSTKVLTPYPDDVNRKQGLYCSYCL